MAKDAALAAALAQDGTLIQIVDRALAETAAKSGSWLVCGAGCWQCCVGAFAINALDAARLRAGLLELRQTEPERAGRVAARVSAYIGRLSASFPGDVVSGALFEDDRSLAAFAEFANDEVCPVLDPESHTCDLYQARPMTCRIFGPPVRTEQGLGVCELCYQGADPEDIALCEMIPDPEDLEAEIVRSMDVGSMPDGEAVPAATIVGYALANTI